MGRVFFQKGKIMNKFEIQLSNIASLAGLIIGAALMFWLILLMTIQLWTINVFFATFLFLLLTSYLCAIFVVLYRKEVKFK